jgi:glycosyltransferase domain-containing protein
VDGLEKLSIVIPTLNRQNYVLRQAHYWKESRAQIHIFDGSDQPITDLSFLSANVHYHHVSEDFFGRMLRAAEIVDTEFVALLGDDDLFCRSGLRQCIAMLDNDPRVFGVVGRAMYFFYQRGKVLGHLTHESSTNYSEDITTGIQRLQNLYHDGKIGAIAYGVFRSEGWKISVRATYGKKFSCAYVYDTFLRTMLTYCGDIRVSKNLTWLCSGENPPIKDHSSFNRKIDIIDWFDTPELSTEVVGFKTRLADALFGFGRDTHEDLRNAVEYVVSALESRYRIKANNRKSLRQYLPKIAQRLVPQPIKDALKGHLPKSLKRIFDWENCDLEVSVMEAQKSGVVYEASELHEITQIIKDFHIKL